MSDAARRSDLEDDMDASDAPKGRDFPPETHRHLSWSSIHFIHSPSSRFLAFAALSIIAMMGVVAGMTHFVRVDIAIDGAGEIASDIGTRDAVAPSEGQVVRVRKNIGDEVSEGEVVAELSTAAVSATELDSSRHSLQALIDHVTAADSTLSSPLPEIGIPIAKFTDPGVLAGLTAVEQSWRALEAQRRYAQRGRPDVGQIAKLETHRSELLRSLRAAFGALESYVRHHEIRAPVAGTVIRRLVAAGDHASANRPVFTILPQGARIAVSLRINSRDVTQVRPGQKVRFRVDAYPSQRYGSFTGDVLSVDQAIDSSVAAPAETFKVLATIEKPLELNEEARDKIRLVLGMRVTGEVVTDRKRLNEVLIDRVFGR